MSSDIWKIGQKMNAEEYIKTMQVLPFNSEVLAVKVLTKACEEMIAAYDDVIEDQNNYILELDDEIANLNALQAEMDEKIKTLLSEIKELEIKEENGTITEEEKEDLENKKKEFGVLTKNPNETIIESNNKINQITSEQDSRYRSKVKIAQNYGETTVEKGTPLANTKVSHGFFKKLFGKTGKSKKIAGENAVKTGNELLDKVSESFDIDKKINSKNKHK